MNILDDYKKEFEAQQHTVQTLSQFMKDLAKTPAMIKTPAERLLSAIGEPTIVDTAKDSKLSRIFGNRTIKTYKAFSDFYGLEETIEELKTENEELLKQLKSK